MASDSAPRSMQGKRALVTGAAQGIGKAIAETLLKHGAKVCLVDVQGDKGAETASTFQKTYGKGSATFIKCDVTDSSQLADTFAQAKKMMSGLDIVVNNAGILHEKQWEKMLAINLFAMIRGTYLAVEHMSRDKGGQGGVVINMASLAVTDTDIVNWTEEQLWGKAMMDQFKEGGILSVSAVTEACMSLLEDQSPSGAVLKVVSDGREMVRPGVKVPDDK